MSWPVVVSHGGGDNSRAMLIEMVRRECRPDLVLFADTGGELPETYENNAVFSEWLVKQGFPPITVVSDGRMTLEEECLEARTLPSLVFGFRSCSDKYKVRPQNRFLTTWKPAIDSWTTGGKVVKFIGYHAGEKHRLKNYDDKRFMVQYPLALWGWDQRKSIEVVRQHGFAPGKSACFFCPARKKGEVRNLAAQYPELFKRAVAMETNMSPEIRVAGLGRNWSWDTLIRADAAQTTLFDDLPDVVPCACFEAA